MPVYLLCASVGEMENVAEITPSEFHRWLIDFKDPQGDDIKEKCWVSNAEEIECDNGRSTAHFVMSWPGSKKQATCSVISVKGVTQPLTAENFENIPLAAFDCRGCEPIKAEIGGGFVVKSSEGAVFDDADLSDDWAEYDEEGDVSLNIMEFKTVFKVLVEAKKGKKPTW